MQVVDIVSSIYFYIWNRLFRFRDVCLTNGQKDPDLGWQRLMFLLFKRNALRESHWNPLAKASDEGMALPFWLNDNPVITTLQIKGDLQDIQARCGSVSLVIVDYVQLIEPREKRGGENRV